ncbi:hypothetical protein R5R35_006135 [Gryllus longicercus]|uniref:RAP domain-containing protein n=1 Tax=Gryllus longicercus TaxID=2509291 RepID=A0AAN9VEM1_9ORTH
MFCKVITKQLSLVILHTNISVKICRLLCGNVDTKISLLQDRFIYFFKNENRYSPYIVHDSEKETYPIKTSLSKNLPLEQIINNVPKAKIPSFLHSLGTQRHIISSKDFQYILLMVDDIFSHKLPCMEKESVLKCIHEWHNICQGNTMSTKLYQEFMHIVSLWLTKRNNNLELLVYVMFYIGQSKKLKSSQNLMKKCLNEIDRYGNLLSLDELCIMCVSSFKCSVPIRSADLLQCICKTVERNFQTIVNDPAYIVTFVKVLRLAKFYSFNIMDKIASDKYSEKILGMNFTAKVHILALYADALYDNRKLIPSLIQSCIHDAHLASTSSSHHSYLRIKDISRFLWAVSYLGYNLSRHELKEMTDELQRSIKEKHHLNIPEHILGSLLSLWCLGVREGELFKDAINEDFMRVLKEKNLFRIQTRLSLLLTCIQIELPALLSSAHNEWTMKNIIPQEAQKKHLQKRIFLKQIFTAVTNLGYHMKLNAVCNCYIPNLNIIGITVTSPSGKILHIEALDSTVCLHETHKPHGLMKLKLRLLQNMDHQVLVIHSNQFDEVQNTVDVYEFLEEKLAKFLSIQKRV